MALSPTTLYEILTFVVLLVAAVASGYLKNQDKSKNDQVSGVLGAIVLVVVAWFFVAFFFQIWDWNQTVQGVVLEAIIGVGVLLLYYFVIKVEDFNSSRREY